MSWGVYAKPRRKATAADIEEFYEGANLRGSEFLTSRISDHQLPVGSRSEVGPVVLHGAYSSVARVALVPLQQDV